MLDKKQLFHGAIFVLVGLCAIGFIGVAMTGSGPTQEPETPTPDATVEVVTYSAALDAEDNTEEYATLLRPTGDTNAYINGQIQGNTGGMSVAVSSVEQNEEENQLEIYLETESAEDGSVTQVITPYQYRLSVSGITEDTRITLYHNGSEIELASLSDQEIYSV